jgi:hypothetical protein
MAGFASMNAHDSKHFQLKTQRKPKIRVGSTNDERSFGELEAANRVSQSHFLIQIEGRIDWQPLQEALAGLYQPRCGRPGYPPLVLLKALLLQRWYNLLAPSLEEAIRDPGPETESYSGSHTHLNHQKERTSWREEGA